ncbi:hypothetical protein SLA2020_402970 [Shorea laevis]
MEKEVDTWVPEARNVGEVFSVNPMGVLNGGLSAIFVEVGHHQVHEWVSGGGGRNWWRGRIAETRGAEEDFVPADIESVGFCVLLGHKQYFVFSDVVAGKMQWYAFHKEPPGGVDSPHGKKERLLKIFEGWCDYVIDLIIVSDEDAILCHDIYDLTPTCTWGRGHVTLLGDSVHAMQPNMSKGGCMAFEDSYQLAEELDKAWRQSIESGTPVDIVSSLRSYERNRRLRVAIIHAMARMVAVLVSNYRSYLDIGFGPLLLGTVVDYMKWTPCF